MKSRRVRRMRHTRGRGRAMKRGGMYGGPYGAYSNPNQAFTRYHDDEIRRASQGLLSGPDQIAYDQAQKDRARRIGDGSSMGRNGQGFGA